MRDQVVQDTVKTNRRTIGGRYRLALGRPIGVAASRITGTATMQEFFRRR
jgi:hypothetical protein